MKIRKLAIISFLGLVTLLSGAYASSAQTVVFEPGSLSGKLQKLPYQ
jgi:hypothetical protein